MEVTGSMLSLLRVLLFAFSLLIQGAGSASAQAIANYFLLQEGTVPVVFTFPHGGTTSVPGIADRDCSSSSKNCGRDTNTHLMAPAISDAFFALTGHKPYLVASYMPRSQVDLNRPAGSQAYDDPDAKPYYDFYHDGVRNFIDEIRATWGSGVLFDVHGQSSFPSTIIRGTQNGDTVTSLLAAQGPVALNGPDSVFGELASLAYSVHPDLAIPFENQAELSAYRGGYTVRTYGSSHADGIDAIQLEIGFNFRSGSAWEQTSIDLAVSAQKFHDAFLPSSPPPGVPSLSNTGLTQLALLVLLTGSQLLRSRRARPSHPAPVSWHVCGSRESA